MNENRRTHEGHMDWQPNGPVPVDPTSPFSHVGRGTFPSFKAPDSQNTFGYRGQNPFAAPAARSTSPAKTNGSNMISPPSSSSFRSPPLPQQYTKAAPFLNPAFATPRKTFEQDPASETSAAEDSPAVTDASDYPGETPDADRVDREPQVTMRSPSPRRGPIDRLFARSHISGRGEVPRGRPDRYARDKVRKRKRQLGDRDVGSVRSRMPYGSDESDSDYRDESRHPGRSENAKAESGWLRQILGAIHDHPNIPAILAGYMHLAVWVLLVSLGMYCLWGFITTFRSDIALAGDHARAELLEEARQCASHFVANHCARQDRPPALTPQCDEWASCMNQDSDRIHQVQVSAKNVAEILNEFAGVLSLKAYGLIVSVVVICLLATRGFSSMSHNRLEAKLAHSLAPQFSQPALPPPLTSPSANYQPYFPQTPGRVKAIFFSPAGTDTDASPSEEVKAIMPPQTPARSPSKGERWRSPTKAGRSLRKPS